MPGTPPTDVALLMRRAGFGATPTTIATLSAESLADVVEHVLGPAQVQPARPVALDNPALSNWQKMVAVRQWWLDRMAGGAPTPLVEKMTLFWHGHFTSSSDKVNDSDYLYRQNALYRLHALGDYEDLAQAMAVEPAMLLYLDNDENRNTQPNDNFARELLELFLLGVGNYTEADIAACARAWTGHTIDSTTRTWIRNDTRHDFGQKTFLGRTANFDGPDTIREIFTSATAAPVAARYLATKLWAFFAHEISTQNPATDPISAMTNTLVTSGWSVREALRTMFLRPEFYSPTSRTGHVFSPIEYMANVQRIIGAPAAATHPEWFMSDMGQELFSPPNVSGWRLNRYWISPAAASTKANWGNYMYWNALAATARPFANYALRSVTQLVEDAFTYFQITEPAPATRAALEAYVTNQRLTAPNEAWATPLGLFVLMMLTPDLQLG